MYVHVHVTRQHDHVGPKVAPLAHGWSWLRNMLSVKNYATCCPLKMQITINIDRFLYVFKLTLKMQQTENVENLSIDILASIVQIKQR